MRVYFEHVLFAVLSRRAGIGTRSQLLDAMEKAGYPKYPEWLRRQLHTTQTLSEDFMVALHAAVPDLTDQDWLDILWARFFPDNHPPRRL